MKVLAIESSTYLGSVALMDGKRLLAERFFEKNAEELAPAMETVLKETETAKSEIGLIAVSSGPGFFTPLKVGAVAAKCLAYVFDIPVASVSSLEILAAGTGCPPDSVMCSAIDARSGMVFWSLFRSQNGRTRRLSEDRVTSAEEMCDRLEKFQPHSGADGTGSLYFKGEGALAYRNLIEKRLGKSAIFIPRAGAAPRASVCAVLGLQMMKEGKTETAFSLSPNYVRKDVYL